MGMLKAWEQRLLEMGEGRGRSHLAEGGGMVVCQSCTGRNEVNL